MKKTFKAVQRQLRLDGELGLPPLEPCCWLGFFFVFVLTRTLLLVKVKGKVCVNIVQLLLMISKFEAVRFLSLQKKVLYLK